MKLEDYHDGNLLRMAGGGCPMFAAGASIMQRDPIKLSRRRKKAGLKDFAVAPWHAAQGRSASYHVTYRVNASEGAPTSSVISTQKKHLR